MEDIMPFERVELAKELYIRLLEIRHDSSKVNILLAEYGNDNDLLSAVALCAVFHCDVDMLTDILHRKNISIEWNDHLLLIKAASMLNVETVEQGHDIFLFAYNTQRDNGEGVVDLAKAPRIMEIVLDSYITLDNRDEISRPSDSHLTKALQCTPLDDVKKIRDEIERGDKIFAGTDNLAKRKRILSLIEAAIPEAEKHYDI